MKDHRLEPEEQLNSVTPEEMEAEQEFSLEDIMREFGGWTKPEAEPAPEAEFRLEREPEPAPAPEPEFRLEREPEKPETPENPEVMRVAAGPAGRSEKPQRPADLQEDTIRLPFLTQQEEADEPPAAGSAEMPEEPAQKSDGRARRAAEREVRRLQKLERQRRRARRAALRAKRREEPEVVYPSPADACAAYAKVGTLRLRLIASVLLTILSGAMLLLSTTALGGLDLTGYRRLFSVLMLAVLLVQGVLSLDVLVRGVYQALRLRFDLKSLLCLAVAVTVCDGFFAVAQSRVPMCTPMSLALLLALWSVSLEKRAKWRTLKTVLSMDMPIAAVRKEKAWRGLDCILRAEGDLEGFTAMLETPDAAEKTMRVYAPAAAVLTAVMAAAASLRADAGILWAWSALLTAALPAGAFLACFRPFDLLASRLHKAGGAICGWRGAKILSGECGIAVTDADLFPGRNITINGLKLYSDLPARQVVGYATAVVQAAGSGLLPLFEQLMVSEDGRRYLADSFRQYEGGGLGAEIRGDVVLLGSLRFMRLMGVRMPENVQVQSAVYMSVNRELTAVFALNYAKSSASRGGLQGLMHSPGLTTILATRDFMITPSLVKKRYKVSADRLEFPTVAERTMLSDPAAGEGGRQGGLIGKDSFAAFAAVVAGGRQLRKTVHTAVVISLLAGILGMALMAVLTYLGAVDAASAANLTLYQLLWLAPTVLVTGFIGKS